MTKELICTNCGHNYFVKLIQLFQASTALDAMPVKVISPGVSSADPQEMHVITTTAANFFCAKCNREAKTYKLQE